MMAFRLKKESLALLLLTVSGCQWQWIALHVNNAHHMTVERATTKRVEKRFQVVDATTMSPVPKARVILRYNFDWMDDWSSQSVTDSSGIARIRVAVEYFHLLRVRATADGYHPSDTIYGIDPSDDPVSISVHPDDKATDHH